MRKLIVLTAFFFLVSQAFSSNTADSSSSSTGSDALSSAPSAVSSQTYFNEVKKSAKAYRIEVSFENMKIVKDQNGKDAFYITIASNRNNFEMVMLVGYIAAGQAMKTGFEPSAVFVTIDVPLGEGFRLLTTASTEDLKQLLSGKINTQMFVREVNYI